MNGASIIAMQNLRDGKPADLATIPSWARIAPNDLVPSSTWRLSPAGLEVLALIEDLDREAAANIDRISREIVSDKWTATGEFQRRALEAEATCADLRLALAAERDEPDAGKDLGYDLVHGVYVRPVPGGHIEVERREERRGRWRAYRFAKGMVVPPWRSVWGETARDVMREANKKESES